MGPNKRRDFFLAVFVALSLSASFYAGFALMQRTRVRAAFLDICDLVSERFYLKDRTLDNWVERCRRRATGLPLFTSHASLLQAIQEQMDLMHVSHFMIYTPSDDQKLWKGQAQETGLRGRWMEDKLVIYQIIRKSPAEAAGFRLGDAVTLLDGREPPTADVVQTYSGVYTVERDGKTRTIALRAAPISIDGSPFLRPLTPETALVELSSFRAEYFENKSWRDFVSGWSKYRRLILDLRENVGGNFVAVLRALSPFFCEPTAIGKLVQPRRTTAQPTDLANTLSDDAQIAQIDRDPAIWLRTYSGYGCFRGPVIVLVAAHTSSVSEIFASAMERRPHTLTMGQPTAGDVVLAVWYDLPNVGPGFSISIPEALYQTPKGEILEGLGVFPKKEIFDNLKIWQTGQDSWLRAAIRTKGE